MRRRPPSLLVPTFLLASLLAPAPAAGERAEEQLETRVELPSSSVLHVSNLLGSIVVEGGGAPGAIEITATVVAEAKTEQEARRLARSVSWAQQSDPEATRVRVEFPLDAGSAYRFPRSDGKNLISRWISPLLQRGSYEANYHGRPVQVGKVKGALPLAAHVRIVLPPDATVRVDQVAGDVECRRLRGRVAVVTGQGAVRALQAYGALDLQAGGSIEVKSFRGETLDVRTTSEGVELLDLQVSEIRLTTDGGRIRGERINADELVVESADGGVDLAELESESLEVSTGSGSVELATRLRRARRAAIRTVSGSVSLQVATLSSFDLETETPSGEVQVRGLPLDLLEQDGARSRYQYRSGGAALRITTDSGKVTLRAL